MGKPLNRGAKVKIKVGEHKGETGTYEYYCCSGYKIRLSDGSPVYLRKGSDFSVIKELKTEK